MLRRVLGPFRGKERQLAAMCGGQNDTLALTSGQNESTG